MARKKSTMEPSVLETKIQELNKALENTQDLFEKRKLRQKLYYWNHRNETLEKYHVAYLEHKKTLFPQKIQSLTDLIVKKK